MSATSPACPSFDEQLDETRAETWGQAYARRRFVDANTPKRVSRTRASSSLFLPQVSNWDMVSMNQATASILGWTEDGAASGPGPSGGKGDEVDGCDVDASRPYRLAHVGPMPRRLRVVSSSSDCTRTRQWPWVRSVRALVMKVVRGIVRGAPRRRGSWAWEALRLRPGGWKAVEVDQGVNKASAHPDPAACCLPVPVLRLPVSRC